MTKKKESSGAINKTALNMEGAGSANKTIVKAKEKTNDVANRLGKYARIPNNELVQSLEQGPSIQGHLPLEKGDKFNEITDEMDTQDVRINKNMEETVTQISAPSMSSISSSSSTPTLQDIFAAIQTCNTSLKTLSDQFNAMRTDISLIRQDMHKMRERMNMMEERISNVEDEAVKDRNKLTAVLQLATTSQRQLEDMENQLRRNNIRVVGLPEKVEGQNPVDFAERWLRDMVGNDLLSPLFAVERAHRVPGRLPVIGGMPRPFLIKLLNFQDKETVFRKAREMGNILFNGVRVMLFPDFSRAVQQQRVKFVEVKSRLRRLNMKYTMMYPAKLRVVTEDTTVFFESPSAASAWLESKGLN